MLDSDIEKYKNRIDIELDNNARLDKILKESSSELTEDEKEFIREKQNKNLPSPHRLCMIDMKQCDFCFDDSRSNTYQLYLNFGFQICPDCNKLEKAQVAALKYTRKHKSIGIYEFKRWFPKNHYFNKTDLVYVQRSNGDIEKWKFSHTSAIEYKDNKLYFIVHNEEINKKLTLEQLAILNPEIFTCRNEIMHKMKLCIK